MSKPEGPVNIDLLAEKEAEQPEAHPARTLADYMANRSRDVERADLQYILRDNVIGGHNNLLDVTPIVNPADPRLRFSADDAVDPANGAYSYATRLLRDTNGLDGLTLTPQARRDAAIQDQARRLNRVVNNELAMRGSTLAQNRENYLQAHIDQAHREFYSFPPYTLTATYCGRQLADYSEDEWAFITRSWREEPRPDNSYSPVFLPPAQYEADGNQLSVTVEQRHLPNLPRILTGLGILDGHQQDLTARTAERGGILMGWPIKVVRHLNTGAIWIESPNTTGRYPGGEVVQGSNPEGWEGYDQRRAALNRALRGGQ